MLTYGSDNLMWCVRRAGIMPKVLSQAYLLTPTQWLVIIFGYGYPSGFLLYLLIQFDPKFEQRNNRDWHYTTWLVALPACIGMSPNFHPISCTSRIFFALMLASAFFFFQIIFTRTYLMLHYEMPWRQISSFKEIIEEDYGFVGAEEALKMLRQRPEVITLFFGL